MSKDIYISNIQRFSLDDGEGIRTTVFFKGCNLRCRWCHNPECIGSKPVLQYAISKCESCQKCVYICKYGVHSFKDGKHIIDRKKCILCGKCAEGCSNEALEIVGKKYSCNEVMKIILKDIQYYRHSNGGITFSGGEPMLALPLLKQLLVACKEHNLNTAVDTAANVKFEDYADIMAYTDVFLIDLKIWDEERHRYYTGVSNRLIKENIKRISDAGKRIIIRTPVIGSVNDSFEELSKMADFLKDIKMVELVQLLPYHQYGVGKYNLIGVESEQNEFYVPNEDFMRSALEVYKKRGINVSF